MPLKAISIRSAFLLFFVAALAGTVSPVQAQKEIASHDWTITFQLKADPRNNPLVEGYNYVPTVTGKLPYQSGTTWKVEGAERSYVTSEQGNELLMLRIPEAGTIKLVYHTTTRPYSFRKAAENVKVGALLTKEARLYLGASQSEFYQEPNVKRIDPESRRTQEIVKEIQGETVLERVEGILAWMQKNLTYKALKYAVTPNAGGFYLVADDVLQRGYGECSGWSAAFTQLCRAAGIPARDVWGVIKDTPVGDAKQGKLTGHAWAEIYIGGLGWVPVEPQRPAWLGTAPENYIRMAHYPLSTETYPWHFVPQYSIFFLGGNTPDFVEQ